MAHLSPTASRSGLRRALRPAAALLAGLLVATCADNPTAPNRPGFGALRIQPAFDQNAQYAPLLLNQVRAIVVRPPSDTVIDTLRAFNPTDNQLRLSLSLALQASQETMEVTLHLLSGQTLLFAGTEAVEVRQGGTPPATSIPVTYEGPGANADSIEITPRDTIMQVGATAQMNATAYDAGGLDVGQFYISWGLVGSAPGASIDAGGLLHAPTSVGTFYVRGITPSGLRDSVQVTAVPAPAMLAKSAGDNQTGAPGEALEVPLAVLVSGTGGVAVPGVQVTWEVTTGGGTLDSSTTTTDALGIARTTVVLGQAVGAQTFTASAPGLTPVVFTATAQGLTIDPAPHLITSGLEHTCELRGGAAFCWGGNSTGQLGDNNGEVNIGVAVPVQGGLSFTSISAGEQHTCGLTAAGQVYCWGSNSSGQLGDGTTTDRGLPTLVSGGRTFAQIEAGGYHTCALTVSGEAFCWGSNDGGQIGDGTSANNRLVPTAVIGGLSFMRLTGGEVFNCALTPAGAAYCWGQNGSGQLGDGSTTGRTNPVAVGGGLVFADIGAGYTTACGLTTTGAGYCWGNFFNQTLTAPQAIGGGPFVSFSTGGDHVCAITASGAAFCGGDNSNGQLGDGNAPTDSPTPVAVAGGLSFTELGAGGLHTCGRTSAGTYCWGRGNAGQAGDGAYLQRATPVQVRGPASSIALNDGNNQSALPGTPLSIAPSVIVRDPQGQPLPGVRVAFAVTAGGGSLTLPNPFTDDNGVARVGSWTLGSTPGANALTATATYPALAGNPVSFTATGGAPPAFRTWTGAADTDWSNPANWSGGVPGASDSAVVVAATNAPQLTAGTSVGALTILGGTLRVNGQTLTIARNLTITGGGLDMTNGADEVVVGGDATFNGADASALLTAGELTITGNLTQLAAVSPFSFAAGGTHITLFSAGAHTISFASPGAPSGSGFADLEFAGNGTVTLATAVWVRGTMDVNAAGQVFSSSNGSRLGVERLVATAPVTFNNVPLVITQTQQTAITNQPLTFQNMATNVVQLEINHPGSSSPLTLGNFGFSTTPVAPSGYYLSVNDNLADANPLVINMTGATPASGAPFIQTSGGATVNWGAGGSTVRAWTGAVSGDWNTAGNWSNGIPQSTDDVVIDDAAQNEPELSASTTIHSLSFLNEGNTVRLIVTDPAVLSLTGNLLGNVRVLGKVELSGGATHTIRGQVSSLTTGDTVIVTSSLGVDDDLTITGGQFDMRGVQVFLRNLVISGSGTLRSDEGSFASITGNATFGGGPSTGLIVGGDFSIGGNVTVSTPAGFAPNGGNAIRLNGTGTQSIAMAGSNHFMNLYVSNPGRTIELTTPIDVVGLFDASDLTFHGAAVQLRAGGLNLSNVVFDNVRLLWSTILSAAPYAMNQVTFQGYSNPSPQLQIEHPGMPAAGELDFDRLTFTGTPVTVHLAVIDNNAADGNPLVVNLTNTTPSDGTGLYSTANGATVNWSGAQQTWTWTGAIDEDWSNPGNWDQGSVPTASSGVAIGPAANQPTLTANSVAAGVTISGAGAALTLGGHTLTLTGGFVTHTDGVLISTDPADRLIVPGSVAFQGGDETGLITAGELLVGGDFSQQVQTSPFSFVASGSHRTVMTNAGQLQSVRFCCTANTSKFMNLDISQSAGINIQSALNGVFVADTFIVQPGAAPAPRLYMLGSPFQARRLKVNKLIVDRGTLTLNEGGVAGTQQFDNVTFENYLPTQTQFAVTAVGSASVARVLTFTNLTFQTLSTGNTGRYLNATSTANALTIDLTTANVANGPEFTTASGGAVVNWPGATIVNTWTGATSIDWNTPGNWSLGRIPVATDSIEIPNAVPNWPTLSGRHTVAAMFEDGRLTINGGTLEVTRGTSSNVGINRIIQTTLATDSLIIGGTAQTAISTILGVVVLGGDLVNSGVFNNSRLVLNGAGPQTVAATGGLLIVNKSGGVATLSIAFNGDSVDVISGGLSAPNGLTVATGLSAGPGTSVASTNMIQVGTTLTVAGTYLVSNTRFKPQIAAITIPVLPYQNLLVEQGSVVATASLVGRTVATGNLSVTAVGTDVNLNLNGNTLVVGGNVNTGGLSQARIRMNNPVDSLLVTGSATFASSMGANPGNLTAGVLQVGGSFTQSSAFGGPNFQSTGTHKVILTALNPTVSFDMPGGATNLSRFNDLAWTGAGTLTITGASDSTVIAGVFTTTTAGVTIQGAGVNRSIRFASLVASGPVVFNNTRVIVAQPAAPSPGAAIGLSNVTFLNTSPSVVALTIQHPGFTGGLALDNLTFNTSPSAGGFYIDATDNNPSDGLPLVVNVTNTTPASGSPFTQVANGATINWPFAPAAATWTGAVSTAWEDPANWDVNAVPGSTTVVTIPAGTPFAPTAGAVVSAAGDLTVATGATLTLASPFNLAVSGNVDAQGNITPNSQALTMNGANVTLRGNVPQLTVSGIVTLNGNTTAASNGPCVFNGTAELIVNGFTFSCFQLQFNDGARIQMTNPADSVVVLGSTQFSGGSTLGRLTAGVLDLKGSFTQDNSGGSNASFASTGTRVRSTGATTTTFSMANGLPGESRFSALLVNKTGGSMNLTGELVAINDSMIVSSATSISVPGTVNPNLLRLAAGAGLTGAGTIQIVGDSLFVATPANYTIGNTLLYGTGVGNQQVPALPYPSLTLENSPTHTLVARTATAGPVFVVGGNLVLGGHTLSTAAGFQVQDGGGLIMNNGLDSLLIGGNAFFLSSIDGTGNLTAGVLRVAQNMSVEGSPTGFAPSGTHKTVLASVATSNVNWTGLGAVPIQFQDLEANANNLSINYARVNGTMTVTGNGGINVSSLNVRGQLTTSAASGMGIDSLYLGAAVPITPGSGRVAANVYVLDNGGAQAIPTLPVPTAGGADSAALVIRSTVAPTGNLVLKGLLIDGNGQLDINGQTVNVFGNFATANNGTLVMNNSADRLNVTGATTFGGGSESSLLTDGILTTSGRFTQDGTNSTSSFAPVGSHLTRMEYLNPGGNVVTFTNPTVSAFYHLDLQVGTEFATDVAVFGDMDINIPASTNIFAKRLLVQGAFSQSGGFQAFVPDRLVLEGGSISVTAGTFAPDTVELIGAFARTLPTNGNTSYGAILVRDQADVTLEGGALSPASVAISESGILRLNHSSMNISGALTTSGQGRLQMTNGDDVILVQGTATFSGGSTLGLLTDGRIDFAGNFIQSADGSTTSYAPGGLHRSRFISSLPRTLDFGSPGGGVTGSHFQDLELTSATGGVTLTVNSIVDGTLFSSGAGRILGGGASLTARQFQVTSLIADNTTMVLDEQGISNVQQFDNVSFVNFTSPGARLLRVVGEGSAGPRALTFSGLNFPALPLGDANYYVTLDTSNGQPIQLTMQGSNVGSDDGPGFTEALNGTSVIWP